MDKPITPTRPLTIISQRRRVIKLAVLSWLTLILLWVLPIGRQPDGPDDYHIVQEYQLFGSRPDSLDSTKVVFLVRHLETSLVCIRTAPIAVCDTMLWLRPGLLRYVTIRHRNFFGRISSENRIEFNPIQPHQLMRVPNYPGTELSPPVPPPRKTIRPGQPKGRSDA